RSTLFPYTTLFRSILGWSDSISLGRSFARADKPPTANHALAATNSPSSVATGPVRRPRTLRAGVGCSSVRGFIVGTLLLGDGDWIKTLCQGDTSCRPP